MVCVRIEPAVDDRCRLLLLLHFRNGDVDRIFFVDNIRNILYSVTAVTTQRAGTARGPPTQPPPPH